MVRAALVLGSLLSMLLLAQAAESTFTLTCNLTEREVVRTGGGSDAVWKRENTKSYVEKDEINLASNTWRVVGSPQAPSQISAVDDEELVLLDYSMRDVNNHWTINRVTGEYSQTVTRYDRDRNETTEETITGTCKKANSGPRLF